VVNQALRRQDLEGRAREEARIKWNLKIDSSLSERVNMMMMTITMIRRQQWSVWFPVRQEFYYSDICAQHKLRMPTVYTSGEN
jgi:hypothetical protein